MMTSVTFITGNQDKIDFMGAHFGFKIDHEKVELEEIQSMDLAEIIEHKAQEAYQKVGKPVLVEDVALFCDGLKGLPGPLVKWFLQTVGNEEICRMAHNTGNDKAEAAIMFAYYDGQDLKLFDGRLSGRIASEPRGGNGYGWDPIFIPEGSNKTYAEMTDEEIENFGLRTTTVFPEIKKFLTELDKI